MKTALLIAPYAANAACGTCQVENADGICEADSSKYSLVCDGAGTFHVTYDKCLYADWATLNGDFATACPSATFTTNADTVTVGVPMYECGATFQVNGDIITFNSAFGGTTATATDEIYLESGSLSIDLTCSFPMSYTLRATVATNPAIPTIFEEASDAAIATEEQSNLSPKSLMEPDATVNQYADDTFTLTVPDGTDHEIGSMYYYQIDAPMQMPILGFTAYDCRMVINMDDLAARREFNFITNGCGVSMLKTEAFTEPAIRSTYDPIRYGVKLFMLDTSVMNQELECQIQYCLGTYDSATGLFTATDSAKCGVADETCTFTDDIVRTYLW